MVGEAGTCTWVGEHLSKGSQKTVREGPTPSYTGYYPKGAAPKSNQQAQIDMIEETLSRAGVREAKAVGNRAPETEGGVGNQ